MAFVCCGFLNETAQIPALNLDFEGFFEVFEIHRDILFYYCVF